MVVSRTVKLWKRMLHTQFKALNGSLLLVVISLAAFYSFEVYVFAASEDVSAVQVLTLDKVMVIAALFCASLAILALQRVREARRETERRIAAESEARAMALHDALTGLPNRRFFDQALSVVFEQSPGRIGSHSLIVMDLNGFKRINDLYGHQAGDDVLIQVGRRLAQVTRDTDILARLGGDEFAVLATSMSGRETASGVAKRIIDAFSTPIYAGETQHNVGIALGIACIPGDGTDPDTVMRKADVALYRAKEDKKFSTSSVRFFEPAMDVEAAERDEFERDLREAIAQDKIEPFYQPLVDLNGGDIVGFEALARWNSDRLGQVPAERLISVAENVGVIRELSVLLLRKACQAALTWPSEITLAFNVSGMTLQDPCFGDEITAILADTGLPACRLELEITESALVPNPDVARVVLDTLRNLGIRIALDDFGTGYSSFRHLRDFKPDKIKIDRSFVEGIDHDADSATIVHALIGLGSGLGATTTAEGVETRQQLAFLAAEGCNQGQGFLFSRAVSADQALLLLKQCAALDANQRTRVSQPGPSRR